MCIQNLTLFRYENLIIREAICISHCLDATSFSHNFHYKQNHDFLNIVHKKKLRFQENS